MLMRAVVSVLLVVGFTNSPTARAMDSATLLQFGLDAGTATGFLIGCRVFLNSLKPKRSVAGRSAIASETSAAPGTVTIKDKLDARIADLAASDEFVVFSSEQVGDKVIVRPILKEGNELNESLGLQLIARDTVVVSFKGDADRMSAAKAVMNDLVNLLVQDRGYSAGLQIDMAFSERGSYEFTVRGAKDEQEMLNTYLMILKTWALVHG